MARRSCVKAIPVYPSTIAKIEAERKSRAVRLAEAAAIADLFEVSVDTLLGRSVPAKADEMYTLRALVDTAQQAAWQLWTIERTMRDRVAELDAFNPKGYARTISDECTRVCDMLGETHEAIRDLLYPPKGAAIQRFTRKLLRDQLDREESDDEA